MSPACNEGTFNMSAKGASGEHREEWVEYVVVADTSATGLTVQVAEYLRRNWRLYGNPYTVLGNELLVPPVGFARCERHAQALVRDEAARRYWLREITLVMDAKPVPIRRQRQRLREIGSPLPQPGDWRGDTVRRMRSVTEGQ